MPDIDLEPKRDPRASVAGRIGMVLHWLGIALAVAIMAIGSLYAATNWQSGGIAALIFSGVSAAAVYAVGRAFLFILGGR